MLKAIPTTPTPATPHLMLIGGAILVLILMVAAEVFRIPGHVGSAFGVRVIVLLLRLRHALVQLLAVCNVA